MGPTTTTEAPTLKGQADIYATTTTLASTTLPVISTHGASVEQMPVNVSLNEVKRNGSLVSITWTVSAPASNTENAYVSDSFENDTPNHPFAIYDGVSLVDQQNQRNYPTAYDSQGGCLCSSGKYYNAPALVPGSSVVFSNETGAPPADIHTVDIQINGAGIFAGVPLA